MVESVKMEGETYSTADSCMPCINQSSLVVWFHVSVGSCVPIVFASSKCFAPSLSKNGFEAYIVWLMSARMGSIDLVNPIIGFNSVFITGGLTRHFDHHLVNTEESAKICFSRLKAWAPIVFSFGCWPVMHWQHPKWDCSAYKCIICSALPNVRIGTTRVKLIKRIILS